MLTQEEQLKRFREGFPSLKVLAPAVVGRGIERLDEAACDAAVSYAGTASVQGRVKFVPASGAASRMFKDIFAGMDAPNEALHRLSEHLSDFAWYDPAVFGDAALPLTEAREKEIAALLLTPRGLDYGSKPKGVLCFHRYPAEVRTAFAEHLVEGAAYMRNADGTVRLTVTVSPEHLPLFEEALEEVRPLYERRYGVRYDVRFTFQDPATDTLAVNPDNTPFLLEDGSILHRPAGHGALIYNLNAVEEELVSVKNIDNVAVERLLPLTARWKQVLAGRALQLRDRIFSFLDRLDAGADAALCDEIEAFLLRELCISLPPSGSLPDRASRLHTVLNRPIRVCGMVVNTGEPGGGPFIVEGRDGSTSLQILEAAQIDRSDPMAAAALASATHFNPVDLVCCLRDYKGGKFDLLRHVDPDTGFISSKSYRGRELKALELPGLWNGAMSDWNTLFVEVPEQSFNPVKTVLDLLRPAHRA
ncbi:MAG: DUF4301 family protein [Bacteroidales bacterium]|nr:DUF4301 family protein [Bacteroidales bacterium]